MTVAFLGAACGSNNTTTSTTTTTTTGASMTTTSTSMSSTSSTGGGGGMAPAQMEKTISGDATWTVTFDDTAKAAGSTDCSYTRHYEGVEDESAPWFCPSCVAMFRATVNLTPDSTACYSQVSSTAVSKQEYVGYDASGTWYRGFGGPTSENGKVTGVDTDTLSLTNSVADLDAPKGGKMAFAIAGTFKAATAVGDKLNGFETPATYACGWTKPATPLPAYTGDYTVALGKVIPDGIFKDKCDEPVRLYDLAGTYMVVDMAAIDCPPCQAMADQSEQFLSDMKAQGIDVQMVTLLAPSLANPLGIADKGKINLWMTKHMETTPVLADRGWGVSMFEPIYMDMLGYPSWVIVDPKLNVIHMGNGFGDFTEFKQAILDDKAKNP